MSKQTQDILEFNQKLEHRYPMNTSAEQTTIKIFEDDERFWNGLTKEQSNLFDKEFNPDKQNNTPLTQPMYAKKLKCFMAFIVQEAEHRARVEAPWIGTEHGYFPSFVYFKNKSDAQTWIKNKYEEIKNSGARYKDGTFGWKNKEKTAFTANMESVMTTEEGTEYDETPCFYSIEEMKFELLTDPTDQRETE